MICCRVRARLVSVEYEFASGTGRDTKLGVADGWYHHVVARHGGLHPSACQCLRLRAHFEQALASVLVGRVVVGLALGVVGLGIWVIGVGGGALRLVCALYLTVLVSVCELALIGLVLLQLHLREACRPAILTVAVASLCKNRGRASLPGRVFATRSCLLLARAASA